MNVQSNKITLMQYIFLIHGVQVRLYVLTFPRNLALNAGTDGWITLIICWILSIASSLIVVQIMKKYPNGTIIDLFSHFFGKWAGQLGAVIFSLYFGFLSTVYLIGETLFIQEWILPFTSTPIILFLLAIPTYLLVRTNMTILGRYSQFIFLIAIWILIFLFIPLKFANWLHFLPIGKEGWKPIFVAVEEGLFPFIGFEIAFFLYPFLQKKRKGIDWDRHC